MIEQIEQSLARIGVRPSKGRGQNFLASAAALSEVLQFAAVAKDEVVIEIGPGLGALSGDLLISSKAYAAVEIEERFARHLAAAAPALRPEQIKIGDIRRLSIEQILTPAGIELPPEGATIVSNLPYSISTDVVEWIIARRRQIKRASLLLQKEFAERIAAEPGCRAFGSLSVYCQVYAKCSLGAVIAGGCFYPPTEVESRLVELRIRAEPLVADENESFFKFVRACFAAKRKTVLNNLAAAGIFKGKSQAEQQLRRLAIDPSRRAEALSIEEFVRIFQAIKAE